jgi:hypothetical protein
MFTAAASVWMDLYQILVRKRSDVDDENQEIRMSLVQQDLHSCTNKLNTRETELINRIDELGTEAVKRNKLNDLAGARKRLGERKRTQQQLDKLRNCITVIDIHRDTIDGTEFDKSILHTLRASGDAIKRLTIAGGITGAEDIIAEVEQQMDNSMQINTMLSSGSVSGMVNSGNHFTDEELELELAELMGETPGKLIPDLPAVPVSMAPSIIDLQANDVDLSGSRLAALV